MVEAREHTIDSGGSSMRLFEAHPEQAKGAVVVLQEAFGVNDHIKDICARFAAEGYLAVAPEMYHRSGGGTVPYGDYDLIISHVNEMTDAGILTDIATATAFFNAAGFADDRIAMVGFCMGGRMTFLAAAERKFGAAVGFYGGGIVRAYNPDSKLPSLMSRVPDLKTPWLGLFGDLDRGISIDDVEQLREELAKSSPVAYDVVRYADANHGFHCDARPEYEPTAAADGWRRTLEWLALHIK